MKNIDKTNSNILANKRILIFLQRGWGLNIGQFLAKKLQQQNCRLAGLTLKRSLHQYMLKQAEVKYDLLINNDEIMSRPKDYLKGEHYDLKHICEQLGVDSIWPIVSTLRNHVRSYKDKYYYSFKQNVSDQDIIDYVMAVYKYILYFFENFNPDLIISPNFVALPHIMFHLYAKKRGVKMLAVTDCKVRGVFIFTHSYQDNEGKFYTHIDNLNDNKITSPNSKKAKAYIAQFRQKFIKPSYVSDRSNKASLVKKIKHELAPYYHSLRFIIKPPINVLKSTGITGDYKPPRILLRDHYAHKKYKRFANKYSYYPFDKLKKFVYFPLQFQPEATIDVAAPYFTNQIEVARLLAMSLPDDYTLVVKDHPEMVGLRSDSYLEKIARTVNVKLIDYRIPNENIIKKTSLIISPSGTTIAEASFYYKPVIQLGNLGTTQKLPNVFKHTDLTTISGLIKKLLNTNLKTSDYDQKLENYIAAAYDVGFDADYLKAWTKGDKTEMEKLWTVYKNEIKNIFEHKT